MLGVGRLYIFFLFVGYMVGWLCHAVIFAGTFVLLDKYQPRLLRRRRVQLEFWVAVFAAFSSMAVPFLFLHLAYDTLNFFIPLAIAIVGTYIGYRRLRERAIESEQLNGDLLGYSLGLAGIGIVALIIET